MSRLPAPPDHDDRSPARVLIVDDEPAITIALSRKLRREGHDCMTAGSAEEALRRLESDAPHVVISDIRMPGMTGLELLREAKRRDPDTQFIIMTAYSEIGFAVEALRHDADDYLLKPFDMTELGHTVKRALEHRRLLRENRAFREAMTRDATGGADRHLEQIGAVAGAIETRDGYDRAHPARVMRYACATADSFGADDLSSATLRLGSLLHDIGKIAIPEDILNEPGPLTPEGRRRVREHPAAGARLLDGLSDLRTVRPLILHHHERWDGTGYPAGLSGAEIPLAARIVAVADAYEAMTHDRPYRGGLGRERAVAVLREEAGGQFDPRVVEAFLDSGAPGLFATAE